VVLQLDMPWARNTREGTVEFSSEIAISLNFTAEHTENCAEAQERIIFDNRTQMNADNQDFKFNLILALNGKLNVRHLII